MAPVTRAQGGGRGTRRGDGRPETVKETTTTTTLAGTKRKGRKRPRISPNPVVDHPMVSTQDIEDDDDDVYNVPPRSPSDYPDRKATMDKCYRMKEAAESKKRFQALETFLSKKKKGLTYKAAIDQLINGILDPTLKKDIIKQICEYVAWRLQLTHLIMSELTDEVEHWDHEVIHLIVGLVDNLKDIVLTIPGIEAISAIGETFLSRELEESSQVKMVEMLKELVTRIDISLLFSNEKMEVWAKRPTPVIDTRHTSKLYRLPSWSWK